MNATQRGDKEALVSRVHGGLDDDSQSEWIMIEFTVEKCDEVVHSDFGKIWN